MTVVALEHPGAELVEFRDDHRLAGFAREDAGPMTKVDLQALESQRDGI